MAQNGPRGRSDRTKKPRGADPDAGAVKDEPAQHEEASVANVAKWLVPSVTALFVIVGYIVQSAQQELLGLFYSTNDTTSLFVSTADFIRDFVAMPLALGKATMDGSLFGGGRGWVLLFVTVVVVAILIAPKIRGYKILKGTWLLAVLLILLVAGKFVLLDEPLAQVRNVVLVWGEIDADRPFIERIRGDDSAHSEAESIVRDIICSRMSNSAVTDPRLQVSSLCEDESVDPDQRRARRGASLTGRLIAQIWSAVLILGVALVLLRRGRNSSLASIVGILAALYTLTVPYAYGKLRKSSYFDLGTVRLVAPATGSADGGANDVQALILSRTASGAVLLVTRPLQCATRLDVPQDGTEPAQDGADDSTTVALAYYPNSQIEAIVRISRFDVIAWAYNNEYVCPDRGIQV